MTHFLAGKNALVTGGSRGIGRAIALGLAEAGANVAVNYHRDEAAAADAAAAIEGRGVRSLICQADVSDAAAIECMMQKIEAELGAIDILVNNAGILVRTPFLDIELAEWEKIQRTNLWGPFMVSQAAARRMVRRRTAGRIVNVSSAGAKAAAPLLAHYGTAKAGLSMLTRQMALELAEHKILVNEINPGLIETDLNRTDIQNPEFRRGRLNRIPLKEIGTPEDVVGAVLFLVSDQARLITGASIFIDGGTTIW